MQAPAERNKGLRIVVFDEGGAGTYSQLLIVKEYMAKIAFATQVRTQDVYPADFFDMMGGVGFGGVIAVLLGSLRMTIDQAIEAYTALVRTVFQASKEESSNSANAPFDITKVQEWAENTLEHLNLPLDVEFDGEMLPGGQCNVVLFAATPARVDDGIALRGYLSPHASEAYTLVQAICATMAVPDRFQPFTIGSGPLAQRYIGRPMNLANPISKVLREAESIYGPDRIVSIILSLGSGRPAAHSLGGSGSSYDKIQNIAPKVVSDGELKAEELSHMFIPTSAYMRLNVDSGMENVGDLDWKELPSIKHHTTKYIMSAEVQSNIGLSTYLIRGRRGLLPLGRFVKLTTSIDPNLQALFGENVSNAMAMFRDHGSISDRELTESEVLRILYRRDPIYDLHGEVPVIELERVQQ
ncbi:hypothetical protein CPB86DRAFT_789132 [Serendipita vermifera]|nr:hypothetical protein CPB86DRAFT_789132 [Serendipita vermifera]